MLQANRGPQVAVARARGRNSRRCTGRQISDNSGTSVAAAHVSGVAALLLATKPKLTPAQVRGNIVRSAHRIPGTRNEVGAVSWMRLLS
jgi:subtilisin family serine protease